MLQDLKVYLPPSKQRPKVSALSRAGLLAELKELAFNSDYEHAHGRADELLIAYINDPDVTVAFESVGRWYS